MHELAMMSHKPATCNLTVLVRSIGSIGDCTETPYTPLKSQSSFQNIYIYIHIYICNTYICLGGSVDLVSLGLTLLHN